jgi:RNA polymerase sigma-70 factor (ECF subfamily)
LADDLLDARDRELLRAVQRGDRDAFGRLFGRYAPTANALAVRILKHGQLAEEAVQEAFLQVWRYPDRYRPDRGSVRSWIMTSVHNRAVDLVRREESQRRRSRRIAAEPSQVEDPAEAVVQDVSLPAERAAVREALAELPDEQREVIELMYFEGLTQSVVADRLGIPLGTVKSRALLGMRRLRRLLVREDL